VKESNNYWERTGKKDMFTWVHRYLRLHSELLEDELYQSLYTYVRNSLIAYLRQDIGDNKTDDIQIGKTADALADMFNKSNSCYVEKIKPTVDELYLIWLENYNK